MCGPLNSFKFHLQGAALGALKSQREFAFPSHCLWILSKFYYLTILFKTAFSSCQNLIFFLKGYFYMCTEKIRKGDKSSAQTVSLLQQRWNWDGQTVQVWIATNTDHEPAWKPLFYSLYLLTDFNGDDNFNRGLKTNKMPSYCSFSAM